MLIRLGDIKANPHRDIGNYPYDEERLQGLRVSIKKTGLWENIVVRSSENGSYELAYGHHRLKVALEILGPDHKADFAVEEISHSKMLEMMILENETIIQHHPTILREDYTATKKFFEEDPEGKKEYKALEKEWNQLPATDRPSSGNKSRWIYSQKMGIGTNRISEAEALCKKANPEMESKAKSVKQAAAIKRAKLNDPEMETQLAEATSTAGEVRDIVRVVKPVRSKAKRKKILDRVGKAAKELDSTPERRLRVAETVRGTLEREPPKKRERPDANEALEKLTVLVTDLTVEISDIMPVWAELNQGLGREFLQALAELVEMVGDQLKEEMESVRKQIQA